MARRRWIQEINPLTQRSQAWQAVGKIMDAREDTEYYTENVAPYLEENQREHAVGLVSVMVAHELERNAARDLMAMFRLMTS